MKKLSLLFLPFIILTACTDSSTKDILDVPGCTNPNAVNYSPYATIDDGSCITVEQKQGVFAINYTATWCGPCGNWGAPKIHDIEAADENVVAITAHASGDPMYVEALYNSFSSSRPTGGGIPSFWVGDVDDGGPSTVPNIMSQTPPAGFAYTSTREGDVLSVEVNTVFFEDVQGEYYLSVYILEDGIDGSASSGSYAQSGVANPDTYVHDFVLRTTATPNKAYGEMLASGTIETGALFTNSYDINLDPAWNDIYVAVCLWKYDAANNFYEFVNAMKKR